jgi:quinol monooxygenase YgiN
MPDETTSKSERHEDASSMTQRVRSEPVESKSHVLTLVPGDLLMGLSVFQIDQPHQDTLVQLAGATARQRGAVAGIQGSAIFRAIGKGDVAVLTQWLSQSAYDQAEPTLLKPPKPDLYRVVLVYHITGQAASRIAMEDGLFHFINVFRLTPGKREDFVQYFQHLIPIVGVQPGCVSANLLISLDERHAVNIGQFQTRQDFQAIFRKPRVVLGFAQGVLRRIVPGPPRLRQYDLVAVSSDHTTQMEEPTL